MPHPVGRGHAAMPGRRRVQLWVRLAGMAWMIALVLLGASLAPLSRSATVQAAGPPPADPGAPVTSPPPDTLTPLRFRHLTVAQGLPGNHAEAILQDRQGFIWLGTWEGMARYDGYGFVTYKHRLGDANSLSSDSVVTMTEDRAGIIWIATDDGVLNRFDPRAQTFTHYPTRTPRIGEEHLTALAEDASGDLWIGTDNGRLDRFDPRTGAIDRHSIPACG